MMSGRPTGPGMLRAFVNWTRDSALPFWGTRGFDTAHDRFVERLGWDGRPLTVPHRAMVQARQIYVYAHAAELGWYAPGAALADAAMASLRRDFVDEGRNGASVAFSIDPVSGRRISASQDSYTHAFVLFAIAHLHRLTRNPELLDFADRVTAFVERTLIDPDHGGMIDAAPVGSGDKRQNPQMHLLEAYLALGSIAPDRGWLERAHPIVQLFRDRLVDAKQGVLPERFAANWSAHPDAAIATVFEPGHHYEWAWLLDRYSRLTGRPPTPWCAILYDTARRTGHAPTDLIYDEVDPAINRVKLSHRLWPHTEAIKAAAIRSRSGHPEGAILAERMAQLLFDHFLAGPLPGAWTDRVSVSGTPAIDHVPASSLYHLMLAATEANSV
jgi:mannose-6-phosphate isomerase